MAEITSRIRYARGRTLVVMLTLLGTGGLAVAAAATAPAAATAAVAAAPPPLGIDLDAFDAGKKTVALPNAKPWPTSTGARAQVRR